jgi:hypothetical protein
MSHQHLGKPFPPSSRLQLQRFVDAVPPLLYDAE